MARRLRVRVMEAKAMFLECYCVDSVSCYYEDSRAGCTRSMEASF
jgi:hypothetical protein